MPSDKPSFVRSVLSGPGGGGSSARVCTVLLVAFPLLWVSYLVLRDRRIPDLTGVTVFITSTTGTLYGVNRVTGLIASKKEPRQCP